jgi:hypothetical protein
MAKLSINMGEVQQLELLQAGVAAGMALRAQKIKAFKDGTRPLDFNELRTLDINIAKCKKELEKML